MKRLKRLSISIILILSLSMVTPSQLGLINNSSKVEAAVKVKISKSKVSMYVGSSLTLKMKGITKKAKWTSSKKSVATVSSKGKVSAKKIGKATIKAKLNKKNYTCKVTVKNKIVVNTPTVVPTVVPSAEPTVIPIATITPISTPTTTPIATLAPTATPNPTATPIDNTKEILALQIDILDLQMELNTDKSYLVQYESKLATAKINLDKAINNKTQQVMHGDGSITYQADASAVSSAQDNVDYYQSYVDKYKEYIVLDLLKIELVQAKLNELTKK